MTSAELKDVVHDGLDPSLYSPTSEEVAFLQMQTGIEDEEELKQHVFAVQREAWSVRHFNIFR